MQALLCACCISWWVVPGVLFRSQAPFGKLMGSLSNVWGVQAFEWRLGRGCPGGMCQDIDMGSWGFHGSIPHSWRGFGSKHLQDLECSWAEVSWGVVPGGSHWVMWDLHAPKAASCGSIGFKQSSYFHAAWPRFQNFPSLGQGEGCFLWPRGSGFRWLEPVGP